MNVNWLVFQKHDGDTFVEFAELLWLDGMLIHRRGGPKTWGTTEKTSLPDANSARSAAAEKRASLEADGFKVVREWVHDPSKFDFGLLQRELEIATKSAITKLRVDHPNLNAFALMTDDDAITIVPISCEFDSIQEADDGILFIPDEWDIWDADEEFDIPYRLILSQFQDDLSEVDFNEYRQGFRNAMINALVTLDSQGFFGKSTDRILMYYVSDSEQDADAMMRLNPDLFERWKAWS